MTKETQRSIFVLQSAEEMRRPYETALATLGVKLRWFQSMQSLVETAKNEPESTSKVELVVVDLDVLGQTIEPALEQLKSTFKATDLIALSSSDSAQMALQCLRSGFSDYLLKPTSPEELTWSIRKRLQNAELFHQLGEKKVDMIRAVTQISNCTAPSLVRLFGLGYIVRVLKSEGAAWVQLKSAAPSVLCALPREVNHSQIIFEIPANATEGEAKSRIFRKSSAGARRKIFIPAKQTPGAGIFVWGTSGKIIRKDLRFAELLVEQCEMSLINIEKFEQIKHQTFIDDLTGLYNSRYLKFALTNAIVKCKEPGQSFSVLFIDVDHFKKINDSHGHLVGSEFLVAIGRTVRNAVRRIDPVFRYGGDEFVVILNETGVQGAKEIAERIRKNIERRVYNIQNQRIRTTVSIGIASFPEHASEKETLLRLADEAMYNAKRGSRNSVHLALAPAESN